MRSEDKKRRVSPKPLWVYYVNTRKLIIFAVKLSNINPMNSNRPLHKLLRVVFPEVLMEYFEISGWHDDSVKIEVWLDERHYLERSDYKSGSVISHGFTDEKVIQDFPLRGKPVYLHVRRRRWYDKATGETFSYTYDDLTAEGTKLTPEFVAFLKVSTTVPVE
ncbi:ISAon1 family transposase N-terminal region protein [Bacteroides caecimuris]|uniref:ISAon1 family transposase N-terminal region protein n=1 Tax=Bacteroides caecimuris TaxID=1796613 RepID=UPI00403FBE88